MRAENAGDYSCEAKNTAGLARKDFHVTIVEFPSFLFELSDVTITDEEAVLVECFALGYPSPEVYWTFDNERIYEGLMITLDSSSKSGKYSCVASNSVGTNETSFNLDVKTKLRRTDEFDEIETNIIGKEGQILELKCPFKNFNEVTWTHDGDEITSDKLDTLMLQLAEDSNGRYECIASNVVEKASFAYNVDVLTSPRIIANRVEDDVFEEIDHQKGQALTLSCLAEGNPKPAIYWSRANKIISNEEILRLDAAEIVKSDNLRCTATNSQGDSVKIFRINFKSKPFIENGEKLQKLEGKEMETIILNCSIGGSPRPHFKWFKNG